MKRKYSQPGKPLGKTAAKEKLLMRHKSGASSSLIFKNYSGQKPFHGVPQKKMNFKRNCLLLALTCLIGAVVVAVWCW
jgi:hypothetical protein